MKYIVANWKQNMNIQQATAWLTQFGALWDNEPQKSVTVVVCPPYTLLAPLGSLITMQPHIALGSQTISLYGDGAHTGLVGANQLKELTTYSIVGHSELRESREDTYTKARLCLANHIIPIICTKAVDEVIPLKDALYVLEDPENISGGTTFTPKDPKDIDQTVTVVKKSLQAGTPVLYGGSVTHNNSSDLAQLTCLDGVLVGSASLKADHFFQIIKTFSNR